MLARTFQCSLGSNPSDIAVSMACFRELKQYPVAYGSAGRFKNLFAAFTSTEVSRVVCAVAQCLELGCPQDLNGHWTSNQEPSM